MEDNSQILNGTTDIVAAYVSNNSLQDDKVEGFIARVYSALAGLGGYAAALSAAPEELKPAVNPKKSVFPDYIICLEDGKRFKSLKRHLRTHYKLTPEEYREKWRLPRDYPMVAASYSAARSDLAKNMGLGKQRQ